MATEEPALADAKAMATDQLQAVDGDPLPVQLSQGDAGDPPASPPASQPSQEFPANAEEDEKEEQQKLAPPSRRDLPQLTQLLRASEGPPVLRDCNYGGWFCELKVVEAIKEYFQFHNLQDSLRELDRAFSNAQAAAMESDEPDLDRATGDNVDLDEAPGLSDAAAQRSSFAGCEFSVARALENFDAGLRDSLFEIWRHLVPPAAAQSPLGCTLELRLRVYFCSFATRKAIAAAGSGSEDPHVAEVLLPPPDFSDLKAFLAAQPSAAPLEDSESLAPLYALPFVPRPHQNPALRFIFEEAWMQKLRTDVQAFLTAHASVRHAPALRHLAGAMVVARCPHAAPPPASWHELLRITDIGLAAANKACQEQLQTVGKPPQQQNSQPQQLLGQQRFQQLQPLQQPTEPAQLLAMISRGVKPMPELLAQVVEARRRLAAVALRPGEAPPAPPAQDARNSGAPGRPSVDTEAAAQAVVPAQQSPSGPGVPLYQERLWPMSREAALRASSASSGLGASFALNQARRLHSARTLESRARTATALLPVPPALDFGRIATLLAGEGEPSEEDGEPAPSILAVLQAVLRRLALPDEPIRPRRAFLAAFSCFGALRTLAARLTDIVDGSNSAMTEMSLAVMAVCACEVVGRREIESAEAQKKPGCISALIKVMSTQPVSSLVHMHCLAVLQRLSLRAQLQSKMIALGALDWVLHILRSVKKSGSELDGNDAVVWCRLGPGVGPDAPDFSIEFTSALLMNLTLRSAGRRRCAELGAYPLLANLIEHPNAQVRTHVNGTLYALLGLPSLRQEAQRQGAEATFRSALERAPEDDDLLRRQLEYLLAQLSREGGDSDGEDSDGEDVDATLQSDEDDGDNFLDEEELAAHFHLASTSGLGQGDGYSPEEIEANAKVAAAEAAASEEALRRFRASPAVADAQQRRFHAFIARSCRNLMSPKRRSANSAEQAPMISSAPSPQPFGLKSPEAQQKREPAQPAQNEAQAEAAAQQQEEDQRQQLQQLRAPTRPHQVVSQAQTAAQTLFEDLDQNGDGRVSRHELKLKMAADNEIEKILGLQDVGDRGQLMYRLWEVRKKLDADGDGYISQEELIQLFQAVAAQAEKHGSLEEIPTKKSAQAQSEVKSDLAQKLQNQQLHIKSQDMAAASASAQPPPLRNVQEEPSSDWAKEPQPEPAAASEEEVPPTHRSSTEASEAKKHLPSRSASPVKGSPNPSRQPPANGPGPPSTRRAPSSGGAGRGSAPKPPRTDQAAPSPPRPGPGPGSGGRGTGSGGRGRAPAAAGRVGGDQQEGSGPGRGGSGGRGRAPAPGGRAGGSNAGPSSALPPVGDKAGRSVAGSPGQVAQKGNPRARSEAPPRRGQSEAAAEAAEAVSAAVSVSEDGKNWRRPKNGGGQAQRSVSLDPRQAPTSKRRPAEGAPERSGDANAGQVSSTPSLPRIGSQRRGL